MIRVRREVISLEDEVEGGVEEEGGVDGAKGLMAILRGLREELLAHKKIKPDHRRTGGYTLLSLTRT
jgi:hypothetical protein